jgi:hypothetical protein
MGIAFRASVEAHATTGDLVATIPASVQAGDLLVMPAGLNNGGSSAVNWAIPDGWIRRDERTVGSNLYAALYVKKAVAGDAGATVTLVSATTGKSCAIIAAYSGADQSASIDAVVGQSETTSTASHTTPTVNTTVDQDVIVIAGVQTDTATQSWQTTAGYTKRQDSLDNTNLSGHVVATLQDKGPATVGSYGGESLTSGTASAKAATWTLAISPQQTTQTARPVSDVTVTNAVGVPTPGAGSGVYADLAVNDDAHYAELSTTGVVNVAFASLLDPLSGSSHTLSYRAWYAGGATSGSQTAEVLQGSTVIASWTDTLTGSPQAFTHTLTSTQANAISDYSALRARFTMTVA